MRRVALRGIRAHLVRFVLSVLAVTLGVAFVAGTFSLRTMMSSTFTDIVNSSMLGDAYVRGAGPAAAAALGGTAVGETRNTIPASLAGPINNVDGVRKAFADISGSMVLVGADGTAVLSTQAPSFGLALHPDDSTVKLVAGRAPHGAGEIALESATLASSGLAIGDSTTVVVQGKLHTVKVVGDLSLGAPMAGATIVFLDVATATAAFAPDGKVATITVYADPGVSEASLVQRLAPVLSTPAATGTQAVAGETMRAAARADIDTMLGFVETFMLVFAGISLFVGAFIISNTFAMSVRQRMREFALLRAIGASPLQVFASILIQAAIVGLAGSALGIGAGLGLVSVLRTLLEQLGMDLSGRIPLDAITIVTCLAIGTAVSVVAAAIPARRAALTAPVEAMRDDVASAAKSLRVRTIGGTILVLVGAGGLAMAMARPTVDGGTMLGLGGAGLILGVLLLTPVIARRTMGVLASGFVAAVKPLGRLARGNVTRNPRRTANTAGALMVGMALVAAASVLAASATASTKSIVDSGYTADFTVQSATYVVPSGIVGQIGRLDSVDAVDALTVGSALVTTAGHAPGAADSMEFAGLPPAALRRSVKIDALHGSLNSLADGQIAVQKSAADKNGWSVGDAVDFSSPVGKTTATIGAIVDTRMLGVPIITSDRTLDAIVPAARRSINAVFITAKDGTEPAALRADLTAVAKPYVVLSVQDRADFTESLADQVNQVLVILYALLGLSIVIAILGIVNTLALSVIERTREIGLMRAVGLGRLQLAGILTIESVLTAVFGTIVGAGVGLLIAAAMPTVFASVGLTTLAIPWAQLAWMLILSVVVGALAALWPAIRAARLPVLEAVASD